MSEIAENKKDSLTKNAILGIFGMVLLKIVSLLTIIIVGYVMTSAEYGNLSTYNTWVTIFGVFIGFQFAGSLQNAYLEYGKEKFDKYCFTLLVVAIGSTLLIAIPFIAANNQLSDLLKIDSTLCYILVFHCLSSFLVGFMSSYFLAQKKVSINLIWTVSYTVFFALFSLLLAYFFKTKELGYAVGMFIPNLAYAIFCIIFFIYRSRFQFDYKYLKFAFIFSLPLIMHMLGNVVLGQSDKLMIRYLINETKTGEYTMVHNYGMLVNSLWGAMNSVFLPYYYDALNEKDNEKINTESRNYTIFFSCIVFGFTLVGREIVKFIINEQYYGGIDIFELSVVAQYFIFVYSFSVNYEFFKKKTVWIAVGTILTALLNIGLNFWFISLWGIFGAALASAIAYLLLVIFHEIIARFVVKEYPVDLKQIIISTILAIIVTTASLLLKDYWIVRWVFGALIGVFLIVRLVKTKRIF